MACCNNNSCAVCNEDTRWEYARSDAYWKRIHEGAKDLTPSELEAHLKFKYNQKIYKRIDALKKKIDVLVAGVKR